MANRYSKLSASKFNPLTREDIFSVPMLKRKQHNAVLDQASALSLFENKALAQDTATVNSAIEGYKSELDNTVSSLNKNGFSSEIMNSVVGLNRKKQSMLSQKGTLGLAQYNYDAYNKNRDEQYKMYKAGKISKDKFERGIATALSNYQGIDNGGVYSPFNGAADTEYLKAARETAIDAAKNTRKTAESLGYKISMSPSGEVRYFDEITKKFSTPKDVIKAAVKNRLMNDSNIMQDLKQRHELGLIGGKDVNGYLDNLSSQYDNLYQDRKIDSKLIEHTPKFVKTPLGIPYTTMGVNVVKMKTVGLADKLTTALNINKSNTNVPSIPTDNPMFPFSHMESQVGNLTDVKANYIQTYSVTKDPKYIKTANFLINSGKLEDLKQKNSNQIGPFVKSANGKLDINSPAVMIRVRDYLKKYGESIAVGNAIVLPSDVSSKLEEGFKLNYKSDAVRNEALLREVKGNIRKVWDVETKKAVDLSNLPTGYTIKYLGYHTSDNTFKEFNNMNPNQLVLPIRATIENKDGEKIKTIFIERLDSEMKGPEFQIMKISKEIYTKALNGIGDNISIDTSMSMPNLNNKGIKTINTRYDPETSQFITTLKYYPYSDGRVEKDKIIKGYNMENVKNSLSNTLLPHINIFK